ncbi:MAG TPA: hypothetical protein VM076_11130 [Gemmatimonadaceae bacterium]|nr:hypothetical protein [Gemmatimonadaceae bacterium]
MQTRHLRVPKTARYYAIGEPSAAVQDLWIVCHGYGQLASTFAASFERLASPSRLIVAPEALSRYYVDRSAAPNDKPSVGASWMTREDREHEITDHVGYLDALHDLVRPAEQVGRVRLRVLGFSQGVATVGRWVALGRVRADQVVLWAGAFPPDVDAPAFARRVGRAEVVLVVGANDQLASWAAADTQLTRFTDAGITARLVTFEGGHRLDNAVLDAL